MNQANPACRWIDVLPIRQSGDCRTDGTDQPDQHRRVGSDCELT
jgi:hypothetical protein